jgi:adenylate cyclase
VRELDRIRVKGKLEPVTIFEVLAPRGRVDPKKAQVVELFHKGLSLYRERKWDEAKLIFERALAIDPDDGPSGVYHERVQDLDTLRTLGPDWDGVFVMTHK